MRTSPPRRSARSRSRIARTRSTRCCSIPYWAKALALDARGQTQPAFDEYVAAVKRQPHNSQAWYYAGRYAWTQGCPYLAYDYLEPYTELNQKALPSQGGALYNEALKRVNNHQYHC